jgi:hypothetical protein
MKNIWVALSAQCAQDKAPLLGGLATEIIKTLLKAEITHSGGSAFV